MTGIVLSGVLFAAFTASSQANLGSHFSDYPEVIASNGTNSLSQVSAIHLAAELNPFVTDDAIVAVPDPSTPNLNDTVNVVDPSLISLDVTPANAVAAMEAQADSAATLSDADYALAQQALVNLIYAERSVATITTRISQQSAEVALSTSGKVVLSSTHTARVKIYKWQLEAFAWYLIAHGAVITAVGGFVDFTGVGIPVGAVMNAIGIGMGTSGSWLLWWTDTYFGNSRTYTIRW
ncbi:MAG: hypothetical protein ACKOXM_01320 [Agromyces sp.]